MQLTSPKTTFSNDNLSELQWVFASVCEALEAEQGKLDEKQKTRIPQAII